MTKEVNPVEFAERVERLCNFLLSKNEGRDTEDRRIVQDLKEDAANIQFQGLDELPLIGLKNFMSGIPDNEEQQ